MIAGIAAKLDPDYPSVVIAGHAPDIDEPAEGYLGRVKPDFVQADDDAWSRRD